MPKLKLRDSFKVFCNKHKFEINNPQLEIIDSLDHFLNFKKNFLNFFLKKKINFVFIYMEM